MGLGVSWVGKYFLQKTFSIPHQNRSPPATITIDKNRRAPFPGRITPSATGAGFLTKNPTRTRPSIESRIIFHFLSGL